MATKTQTDPVAEAEAALVAAAAVLDAAKEHDRQLRQKLLDSEGTVTAQELADSGHAKEHAELGVEAAQLALAGAQKSVRLDRLAQLSAEAVELAGDPEAAIEAMQVIEEAVYGLVVADNARYQNLTRWIATAKREGVPEYEPNGKTRTDSQGRAKVPYKELSAEHGGIGWQEAFMGRGEVFYAAGRRISRTFNPGEFIRAAVERACRRAGGRTADYLNLDHKPDPRLIDNPQEWIRERY